MKVKLKITTEVRCPATTEITVEVPEDIVENDSVEQYLKSNLEAILNRIDKQYEQDMRMYHQNLTNEYPSRPYYWDVNEEDVYQNADNWEAQLDEWEEVK